MDKPIIQPWRPDPNPFRQPEPPLEPMEFLSRSWSASAVEVSRALAPSQPPLMPQKDSSSSTSGGHIPEGVNVKLEETPIISGIIPFSFASSETSQMVLERIMSQSQDLSPRTSGRISNSSDHLNRSHSGSSSSPPISPSDVDVKQSCHLNNGQFLAAAGATAMAPPAVATGSKTVGRWLKDKRQKKKEEVRAHNAQLHAAISVAGVAAAVAGMTTARAASSTTGKDEQMAKNDMAVSSAATLVFAQCVEGAEALGAERDHLTSVVSSALNVRSSGDIVTLTAAAATALRGAATLKARMLKEVWNVATAVPLEKEKGGGRPNGNQDGELEAEENFLGVNNAIELLARGSQLLKRTRNGELHWKMVYVYINRMNQVMLKMKSRHVAGTMTKKKKNVVVEVVKEMPAWPGRHLLEGGADRRYFGLRTLLRGVVEFECRNQREYEVWTQGVSRLLSISAQRNTRYRI